ncbi:MAG: D-glycerate dehydrogenase [Planctomycetes bacterium]|nr:D-glycerate dehydrogenase [Planctomycetota bacterium]
MEPIVLVSRPVFPDLVEPLTSSNEVRFLDDPEDPDEWRRALPEVDALLCQLTDTLDAERLRAGRRLRVISTISVGTDHIDLVAARAMGIQVTHTPGVLTESTADFTFALLLAVARRVVEGDRFVRDGRWTRWELDLLCGRDLHGATLGIIGAGRIGRAVARRARGFGMRLLYAQRRRLDTEVERDLALEWSTLDGLLEQADFVSLHAPLTEETHHRIGARELERMKPTAFLINTARGPLVDEVALADALEVGTIAGAGLDVFEREPMVEPRLVTRTDVVLAPHLASASIATRRRMASMAIEDLGAVLAGGTPRHPVPAP